MNTPKTRPPKRWRHRSNKTPAPNGIYSSGITDEKTLINLGRITAFWPHIEDMMAEVFRHLLGADRSLPAKAVYQSVVNAQIRIKIMKNLLEETRHNRDKGEEYDGILDEFSSLNAQRNNFIHAQWFSDAENRVFYSEAPLDGHAFFSPAPGR